MKDAGELIHVMHLIGSTGLYGAERWILALMRALDKPRIRSTLVNLVDGVGERSAVVQAAERLGMNAFDFMTGGRFNLFATIRLANWVREHHVDIIHGHGFKSDLLGLLTAKLANCCMMTTPHGWSLENSRKLKIYEKIDRFSFRFMDIVCPLSDALFIDAKKYCKNNIVMIANGVDLDEVRSSDTMVSVDGTFVIGYVGRLVESKNLTTLLKAVREISLTRTRVKLRLVGDGVHLHELKSTANFLGISDFVEFLGFQTDVYKFMKGFNCFVLPSLSEGTPRCIMEAMALDIPVVASDIPGNRILITDKENGLLYPTMNSLELAARITYIMDNPEEAAEMVKRSKLKVEEKYSSRKMAIEYTAIYEKCVLSRQ